MTRSMEVREIIHEEIIELVAKALAYSQMPDLTEYSGDDIFHAFQPGFQGTCQNDINPIWLDDLMKRITRYKANVLKEADRKMFSCPVTGAAFYGVLLTPHHVVLKVMITPSSHPIAFD